MILVDTSVWLDFFNAAGTNEHLALRHLIENDDDIAVADIILMEILQGIKEPRQHKKTRSYLSQLPILSLRDIDSYVEAADIYRLCRKRGVTVRSSIDCIIARIAIENGAVLFHKDRDFEAIGREVEELLTFDWRMSLVRVRPAVLCGRLAGRSSSTTFTCNHP